MITSRNNKNIDFEAAAKIISVMLAKAFPPRPLGDANATQKETHLISC